MRVPQLINGSLTQADFAEFGSVLVAMQALLDGRYATLALTYSKRAFEPYWGIGVHSAAYGGHLFLVDTGDGTAKHPRAFVCESYIDQFGLNVNAVGLSGKKKHFLYGWVDI